MTVAYKVRTLDAGSISASDFRAYIDLADMYEPTGAVPVKVDVKNSKVDAVTAKPMVIRVTTEDVQQKKFELTAYTEGETESGYREGTVNIVPTSIYVSGPESRWDGSVQWVLPSVWTGQIPIFQVQPRSSALMQIEIRSLWMTR